MTIEPRPAGDRNDHDVAGDNSDPSPCRPIDRLLKVMARLRDPETGCPWDVEQTFQSIAPYTLEEAYEVADAIERADMPALKSELGDLLLQVVYHARMAEEAGHFRFDDVADAIAEKMIARHPHVFGEDQVTDAEEQSANWERRKAAERAELARERGDGLPSILDDIPLALPALTCAAKLQKRAARVGFDWRHAAEVLDKLDEEVTELKSEIDNEAEQDRMEDELGDVLFSVVNVARFLGYDPEAALRRTNAKFERRFRSVEEDLARDGLAASEATLDRMEAAWNRAKKTE